MTGAEGDKKNDTAAARPSLGFTLPFADKAPATPVEFMTVATAAGMAVGAQFANAFFGMMQATLDAANGVASHKAATPALDKAADQRSDRLDVREAEPAVVATRAKKSQAPQKAARQRLPGRVAKPAESEVAKAASPAVQVQPAGTVKSKRKSANRKASKAADDLKMISGIGPKLEGLLNGMGVLRFSDIAAWTDKDVEHFDRELGLDGRVHKDGWIAQAKALLR